MLDKLVETSRENAEALENMQKIYGAFEGGSKGIKKKPYITKSGVEHTALKSREEYIN